MASPRYRTFVPVPPLERDRLHREAVRVLVLAGDRVLLFEDTDPGMPGVSWWMTPGGGIDPGEDEVTAAVRELREETGLVVGPDQLIGPIARREVVHGYTDQVITQSESFWLLEVDPFEVDVAGHTEEEQLTIQSSRWWSLAELAATDAWIWPAGIVDLVARGRAGADEVDLGRPEESTLPVQVPTGYTAIVLAGGRARRLEGASKPDLRLRGRRLVDLALGAVPGAERVIVVAPDTLELPSTVHRMLEDPPFGGPLAGLAAALAGVDSEAPVVLLGCDVPYAASAVPRLLDALSDSGVDAAVLVDADGRQQWLTAAYRVQALRAALPADPRDRALRQVLGTLTAVAVPARGLEATDIDDLATATALDQ